MKQSYNSALKLGATAGINGGRTERFPDDGFADIGSNEERNSGAEAVPLLEELVEEDNNECRSDELKDEEKTDSCANVGGLAVEPSENAYGGLAKGDDKGKD